jgi:hypothetical protein
LRRVVGKLKEVAPTPTEDHLKVHRSWSSYQSLDQGERYQVKRIVVKQGGRLSLQIHQHRIRGGNDDQILDAEQGRRAASRWRRRMRGIPGRFVRRQFTNPCQCAGRAATRGLTDPLHRIASVTAMPASPYSTKTGASAKSLSAWYILHCTPWHGFQSKGDLTSGLTASQ